MVIGIDGNEANVKNRVGSGVYAFEILKNLYQIDKKNNYKIYLKDKPFDDFPLEGSNWQYLVFGPKKFWTQLALPAKLIFSQDKPDVFFTPGHYAPRFSQIPQVVTIFDLSFARFPDMFKKKNLYQLTSWTQYSISKAKAILTISNFSKKEIVDYYQIDPQKVFVTYPGYNKNLFKPVNDKKLIEVAKRKYKIEANYLLFVGTIQPRKNLLRLLQAFEKVTKKPDSLQLVITGKKGWLYDQFFQAVRKMQDKVRVLNFVDRQDLPSLYSGAKVFIMPSLYEGFGIPVLEAMACGCPVVVSNKSSLPEVVKESGILVDPESAKSIKEGIEKVVNNDQLAQELCQKGTKLAQKFSWQTCTQQTLDVLESVEVHI